MRNVTLMLSLVAIAAVGCGTTMPPQELVDARAAYQNASTGPAAQQSPAELHVAKESLDKAEASFVKDGDSLTTKDEAYVAIRRAQLADAQARAIIAVKAKQNTEVMAQQAQASALQGAQANLANTQQNLAKTEQQLLAESQARQAAEAQAAMAMADLAKIAAVKKDQRGMIITLSGSVLFKTNESTLLPTAVTKLNEVADALIKGNKDANIEVDGFTDSQGQRQYNMDLSQRRADAVKAALVSRGVAADRIKTAGMGPDSPVADNKTAEGRADNRRVEIVVQPSSASSLKN